ncbi:MAG: hypothetical protein ACOVQR_11500 [Flavobacterium sp.]|jgi:hypothetical protein|uniref:hypothetical protein n=1 Tax=Flavobacterium sp. TaxID=239 RepID=UPI003BA661F5
MKQLKINIKDNKYLFMLELLKSMDFVSIVDENDWYQNLSPQDKNNIENGVNDLENGKIFSHEEVMLLAKQKISTLKNK